MNWPEIQVVATFQGSRLEGVHCICMPNSKRLRNDPSVSGTVVTVGRPTCQWNSSDSEMTLREVTIIVCKALFFCEVPIILILFSKLSISRTKN